MPKKHTPNIVEEFARLASQNKDKKITINVHAIEQEYEKRMKRSGLL